jgi:hypothetical protein
MKVTDITNGIREENIREQDLIIDPAKRTGPKPGFHSKAMQDHEVGMARSDCYNAAKHASEIFAQLRHVSETAGIPGWVASKITLAADYLNTVNDYLAGQRVQRDAGVVHENYQPGNNVKSVILPEHFGGGKVEVRFHMVITGDVTHYVSEFHDKNNRLILKYEWKNNIKTWTDSSNQKGMLIHEQTPQDQLINDFLKKVAETMITHYEKSTSLRPGEDEKTLKLIKRMKESKMNKPVQQEINEVLKPISDILNWCMKKTSQYTTEDSDPCWDNYEQVGMKEKNGRQVPNCVPKKKK